MNSLKNMKQVSKLEISNTNHQPFSHLPYIRSLKIKRFFCEEKEHRFPTVHKWKVRIAITGQLEAKDGTV